MHQTFNVKRTEILECGLHFTFAFLLSLSALIFPTIFEYKYLHY